MSTRSPQRGRARRVALGCAFLAALLALWPSPATAKSKSVTAVRQGPKVAVFKLGSVKPRSIKRAQVRVGATYRRALRVGRVRRAARRGVLRQRLPRHVVRRMRIRASRESRRRGRDRVRARARLQLRVAPAPRGVDGPAWREPGSAAQPPGGCLAAALGGDPWPGACWRPFADTSPFNTPLPSSPRLATDSDAIVRRMLDMVEGRGPAELEAFEDGRGGEPTYYSRPTDPVFTVHCTRDWGRCAAEGVQVRIPSGAVPEGNRGSSGSDSGEDAHMTIVDLQAGREVDLWQVQHDRMPASGGRLNVSWGGVTDLAGHGIEVPSAATAAEFASLAGRVRAEELDAGRIDHAIFVVVKCDSGRWVFPARKTGSRCDNPADAPPMGARLRLDYTDAEIDALSVARWKKPLLRAMARYGLIVGDTGTNDLFSIERESGVQYQAMGHTDRWLAYAREHGFERWSGNGGVYIGDVAAGVDWRRLQVVHPCVSQRTC
jgi:hypothetical protein